MRTKASLIFAIFALGLAGCSENRGGVPDAPVTLEIPATGPADGPRLADGLDGRLILSWMERHDAGATLRYSILEKGELSTPRDAVDEARMFVNWADLPGVMQVAEHHLIAHWLRYSADQVYSYDVVVSQSFDDGDTWSEPIAMHTDGTPTEHGFASLYRAPNGVGLLWLDGRETPEGPMTLRAAVITPNGDREQEFVVDESVCDCCQTDVAIAASGPIAAYRDRTIDEIRDIYVSRQIDGTWMRGERVAADDWEIGGCPVNGPSIIADNRNVAVAWFTAAHGKPAVRVVRSSDSGASFSEPLNIASGRVSGYVGLVHLPHGQLAISWVSRNADGSNQLNVRLVEADGELAPVQAIASINQLRVFPQLGFQDGSLYLFWTDEQDEARRMHAARVPIL
jgi:hypothetical protein